jgi:hypothetical protein
MKITDELIETYFRRHRDHKPQDHWAWQSVFNTIQNDSLEDGWDLTIALLAAAPSKKALAFVAAGPLENLLGRHGLKLLSRVKAQATADTRFRYALAAVYLREEAEFYNALLSLVCQYELHEIDPIDNTPYDDHNLIPG